MYNQKIIDIFQNPKGAGKLSKPDGIGKVGNERCGDVMEMTIRVIDGRIKDAKFQTFGSAPAIACSSVATQLIKGKTIDEIKLIRDADFIEYIGELPDDKHYCLLMAEELIHAAVENYYLKLEKAERKHAKKHGITLTHDDDEVEEHDELEPYEEYETIDEEADEEAQTEDADEDVEEMEDEEIEEVEDTPSASTNSQPTLVSAPSQRFAPIDDDDDDDLFLDID